MEAEDRAPSPIFRPQTKLASDSNIEAVFYEEAPTDSDGTLVQVALQYQGGFLVLLTRAADTGFDTENPQAQFESDARNHAKASVMQVRGQPALVITGGVSPGARADGLNPAAVVFLVDGVRVSIYALEPGFSDQDLVALAESVS